MRDKSGNFSSVKGNIYTRQWLPEQPPKALVLLVHGMAEHCGRYQHMGKYLTLQGYALCGLDLPGHGNSAGPRGYVDSFEDFSAVVLQYLDMLTEKYPDVPVYLLGHSMGGLISSNLLLEHQAKFKGCILSAAAIRSPETPPAFQMMILKLLAIITPKLGVIQLDAEGVNSDPKQVTKYLNDPLNYIGKISARLIVGMFNTMLKVVSRASEITIPLLLLHGAEDPMTSVDGSQILINQSGSQDKKLIIYPGLRHEVFNESINVEIFAEVSSWLDQRC
ncbi:MAG: lysophospholipase [Sinobacterium sp.]|jgi:alpha-beta hydrolase superfamily lysophospholipase